MKKYLVGLVFAVSFVIPLVSGAQVYDCPVGAAYNPMTGEKCLEVNSVSGCSSGAVFNVLTGKKCSITNPPTPTTQATVIVTGTPTLKLVYDSAHKESQLLASATISVTAGSDGLKLFDFGDFSISSLGNGSYGQAKIKPISSLNSTVNQYGQIFYNIPAGTSAKFIASSVANPQIMFAGTYTAKFAGVFSVDSTKNDGSSTELMVSNNNTSSNKVTIIGETSPYITDITSSTDVNGSVAITGVRFSVNDNLSIDGSVVDTIKPTSKGITKYSTKAGTSLVVFNPSFYNLTAGSHTVQISNKINGASNSVRFEITGTPIGSAQFSVVGTPTFTLQYNSVQKESSLVASAKVSITAGSKDVYIPTSHTFNLIVSKSEGDYWNNNINLNDDTTVTNYYKKDNNGADLSIAGDDVTVKKYYIVPAGMTVQFSVQRTLNPQQMFAGQYAFSWVYLNTLDNQNNLVNQTIPITVKPVTIIGELSPYLNSLYREASLSPGSSVALTGVRLSGAIVVLIDKQPAVVTSLTTSDSSMSFNLPTTITEGQHSLQVSSSNGASNIIWFTISGGSITQPSITVTSPNGGETYQAGETISVRFTNSGVVGPVYVYLYNTSGQLMNSAGFGNNTNTTFSAGSNSVDFLPAKASSYDTSSLVGSFKIKVCDQGNNSDLRNPTCDLSDNYFTINSFVGPYPPPVSSSVTLLSPNGGQSYPLGGKITFTWKAVNINDDVQLYLERRVSTTDSFYCKVGTAPASAGSATFIISSTLICGASPIAVGNNYYASISSAFQSSVHDTGDSAITLTASIPTTPQKPVVNNKPIGAFDAITNGVAGGWMVDPDAPTASGSVHIYINGAAGAGGTYIGSITPNVSRPDLLSAWPSYTGNHGFSYTIPATYKDGKAHSLYIYGIDSAGGTNTLLSGSPRSFTIAPPVNNKPVGAFDVITSAGIAAGWAVDPDAPGTPISVGVFIDGPVGSGGTYLASPVANTPRPDINTGFPTYTGNHGFSYTIPTQYKDGKPHTLYIYALDSAGGTNPLLSGSPRSFTMSASTASIEIDSQTASVINSIQAYIDVLKRLVR